MTPVRLVLALIAAAIAIPLAAFVEVVLTYEAVSDAVTAASIAIPLIFMVPASSMPVVEPDGAEAATVNARAVLVTVETFA